jgi:hypothetical protein
LAPSSTSFLAQAGIRGRASAYCVTGEALWVVLYVMLGRSFSDRVLAIGEFFGDLTWVIVGLLFLAVLGWKLVHYLRD